MQIAGINFKHTLTSLSQIPAATLSNPSKHCPKNIL
ncbi:MAG: hypothetical protein ACLRMZ_08015 [Blautia marasmi]